MILSTHHLLCVLHPSNPTALCVAPYHRLQQARTAVYVSWHVGPVLPLYYINSCGRCPCLRMSVHSGCVQFGGHRIAGLSGTYVSQHYHWGHHEKLPYDERAIKSVYHVRQLEVHRLMQVRFAVGGGDE